jgi:hypothetical protein
MEFQHHQTMESVIMVPVIPPAKEEYTDVEHHHTMESEEVIKFPALPATNEECTDVGHHNAESGEAITFPTILAAKEEYTNAETQCEKVQDNDAGLLRPHANQDEMTIPRVVQPIQQNSEGTLFDTPVQNGDEASCEPADSVGGRWSSEDGISVIDDSDIPMDSDLSKKETKNVFHLKLVVMLILVVSASTIAASVYRYISQTETSQFESKFGYDASKIFQSMGNSLERTLGSMDSLAVTMVSYARDLNDTWPFVTLPDFGVKMAKLLPLTDAFVISVLPIIYPEKRKEWEEYSLLHHGWVNQSMAIQETWNGYYGPIIYDWAPYVTIHGDDGDIETNVR